jgi:hypothetical protein
MRRARVLSFLHRPPAPRCFHPVLDFFTRHSLRRVDLISFSSSSSPSCFSRNFLSFSLSLSFPAARPSSMSMQQRQDAPDPPAIAQPEQVDHRPADPLEPFLQQEDWEGWTKTAVDGLVEAVKAQDLVWVLWYLGKLAERGGGGELDRNRTSIPFSSRFYTVSLLCRLDSRRHRPRSCKHRRHSHFPPDRPPPPLLRYFPQAAQPC